MILAEPTTFMNLSGEAVAPLARFYEAPPERIVVVHDEMDLDLGRIKWKTEGGAGGHNGVASVIRHLGADGFHRLRLGVGRPESRDAVAHVLSGFAPWEERAAEELAEEGAELVRLFLESGVKAVGDRISRRVAAAKKAESAPGGEGKGGAT